MRARQADPPVDWIRGNLIISPQRPGVWTKRRCWAAYELLPTHLDLAPTDQVLAYHAELTDFFRTFSDMDMEYHLAMVPEPVRAAVMQEQLMDSVAGELAVEAGEYCGRVIAALRDIDQTDACRFRFYLFARLPREWHLRTDRKKNTTTALINIRDFVESLAGIGRPEIPDRQLEGWVRAELVMRANLVVFGQGSSLKFQPLSTAETLKAVRAPMWRGIEDVPGSVEGWQPDATVTTDHRGDLLVTPDSRAMRRLFAGLINHQADWEHLRVTQVVGGVPQTSYQSFLTIQQWSPNPIGLFGGEWAYRLQDLGLVEVHIRWAARDYQRTLDIIASQKRKQDDTSEQEEEHAGGTSNDTLTSRSEAEEMESYVKDTKSPSLLASVVIVVTARDIKTLHQRIQAVTGLFRGMDIQLAHNGSDQFRHFTETIPGADRQVNDYVHRLLPPALATCMIGATTALMDPSGTFIATDDRGCPLWFDPTRALAQLDTSGSAVAIGPMGKGKSLCMNFLVYLAAMLRGAQVLAIDSAKPERSEWPRKLPYLGRYTKVVTLSAHENDRGKLDPFTVFESRSEATNHAISQAAFLTQTKLQDPSYDVLLRAFTTVRDSHPTPSMMAAVAELERLGRDRSYKYTDLAERLAERLRSISTLAYANLLFGDGSSAGIDTTNRITVLQLDRIRRPPENKAVEDYSMDEYLSAAIMQAVVAFANAFGRGDRQTQKIILCDEIRWFVNSTYGRDLIEQQTLVGRALGTQVFLVGQNAAHIPEDLHQHFTLRFAFGAATQNEAVATLRFLGVEPTTENISRLLGLNPGDTKGQCFIRDLDGRIGQAQINLLFTELIDAFNTRSLDPEGPKVGKSENEEAAN